MGKTACPGLDAPQHPPEITRLFALTTRNSDAKPDPANRAFFRAITFFAKG
jgi:hypothetical protein